MESALTLWKDSPTNKEEEETVKTVRKIEVRQKRITCSKRVLRGGAKINLLLTEREGRTGEYWPEVVAKNKNDRGPIFPTTVRAS